MPSPRLSIVITTRNDDFGGDMLHRLRLFLDTLFQQAETGSLDAEVLVVEWNPPPGPRLVDVCLPDKVSKKVSVRFIQVPAEIHRSLRNADAIPLFQMIAKNVGIRRARGEFVLCTNQDILLSDETISFLMRTDLDPNGLYRVARTDVEPEVPMHYCASERLDWCRKHMIRAHHRRGSLTSLQYAKRRGFSVWLADVKKSSSVMRELRLRLVGPTEDFLYQTLAPSRRDVFSNASGDFTLCSKTLWEKVGGYVELPLFSLHIDSIFCFAAIAAGATEFVLPRPCRIYHMDHESSWAVMDPFEKLNCFRTKPWLDYSIVSGLSRHMLESGEFALNGPGWGYPDHVFEELVIDEGKLKC